MIKPPFSLSKHPLGDLSIFKTEDGSITLVSDLYQESFHNYTGARLEAEEKFLSPADIDRLDPNKRIRILDICFGIGYNSASLIEKLINKKMDFSIWALELDQRPLNIAINDILFKNSWSSQVINILNSLNTKSKWEYNNCQSNIIWGDARQTIHELPKSLNFDLILLDPFSPKKCPQLWTEEFLKEVTIRISPKRGRLITYCRAAAIRRTLQRSGLEIMTLKSKSSKNWSNGTLAMLSSEEANNGSDKHSWERLTKMEEEHLSTRASIPYRDPSGDSKPEEIIRRRKNEQNNSNLESTSNWKKRWNIL